MNSSKVTFESLRSFLKDLPNVSHGGCGIAALAMYNFLKKQGEDSELVFLYGDGDQPVVIANAVSEMGTGATPIGAKHCCLRYKGKFIDCETDSLPIGTNKVFTTIEFVPEKEVQDAVNNHKSWNDDFDWKTHLPEVEKFIGFTLGIS